MIRVLAATLLMMATPCGAEIIARSDFQDGRSEGWGATGAGDIHLTSYAGNVSLRVGSGATAYREIALGEKRSVYVQAKAAGSGLGPAGSCLLEAKRGAGPWVSVVTVRTPDDDGVRLIAGGAAVPDGNGNLVLRATTRGPSAAACWFDDVVVHALRPVTPAAPIAAAVLDGNRFPTPIDFSAFAPSAKARASDCDFAGTLSLRGDRIDGGSRSIYADPVLLGSTPATADRLPPLKIGLVARAGRVLPAQRGLIAGDRNWSWFVEPGRAWTEPGEDGLRIALPFALQERGANCTHNGMLLLMVRGEAVSNAAYQIAGETCAYRKFDAWGLVAAHFDRSPIAEAAGILAADAANRAARLPLAPLSELPADMQQAMRTAAGPEPTAYGAVIDGKHYRSDCETRWGDYPACDEIDLPSYSTAKSIFAAVALMRLERLNSGVARMSVTDLVPSCRPGWDGVTLEDIADMATGHYRSKDYEADEMSRDAAAFFDAPDHAAKLAFACGHYPKRGRAGQTWVYRSSDTYILGTALTALAARSRHDLYDGIVAPTWRDLSLSATLSTTLRTEDDRRQPLVGYGLTYQPDDIARIARWLDGGAGGLLDPDMLDSALQRRPDERPLTAGFPDLGYRLGFWSRQITDRCGTPRRIPFMSGYGGISVVFVAPGRIFYAFGDDDHFDWRAAMAIGGDAPCR